MERDRALGDARKSADAGADHDAGALARFGVLGLPAGIRDRLLRRRQRVDDELVHLALLFGRHPIVGVEGARGGVAARHLSRYLRRQIRDIETLDRADAGLALDQALPHRLGADAERRDKADAGDDHSLHASLLHVTAAGARASQ